MKDRVSIIVPVFNQQKYIKKCIESIVLQTYKNIEVIIVNDGSADKTLDICEELRAKDARISIISIKNSGVSRARNIGIDAASGEYLMFVDADDYLDSRAVELSAQRMQETKSDICRFWLYRKYRFCKRKKKNEILEGKKLRTKDDIVRHAILSTDDLCSACCTLYKASAIKDIKFDESLELGEDLLFFSEVISRDLLIYFMDACLYYYRVNDGSCTQYYELEKSIAKTSHAISAANEVFRKCLNKDFEYDRHLKNSRSIDSLINQIIQNSSYKEYLYGLNLIKRNKLICTEKEISCLSKIKFCTQKTKRMVRRLVLSIM